MCAIFQPKTLAKTITYIVCHSPGEFGLFWNPDGTMPWKELYWVLQEDPTLRFVRESHLKEFVFLGMDLPFVLEGTALRLTGSQSPPDYPVAEKPPERLYHGCRRRTYPVVLEQGLHPGSRPFVPLTAFKDLALRMGRRRDPQPMLIEVLAAEACSAGIPFREAGEGFYLVSSIPLEFLLCPPLREKDTQRAAGRKTGSDSEKKGARTPATPGSFFLEANHLQDAQSQKASTSAGKKKGRKEGPGWKRESRGGRGKRSI